MVLYWAVELSLDEVMQNTQLREFIESHKDLIPLEKIHSTLLFVGRKKKTKVTDIETDLVTLSLNDAEEPYIKNNQRYCVLTVKQFGYSSKALALDVESIVFNDDLSECPTNAVRQHVTIALSKDTKAVDSVKTLLGEGTIKILNEPFKLYGKIRGYNY